MARVLFYTKTRLFGVNYSNRDVKANSVFHSFEGGKSIQVESLRQCPSNKNYDFNLDGFKFEEVSPALMEIIN